MDRGSLCLTPVARELLQVHEVLQSLSDSDPLFLLNAELSVLVVLDAIFVEEKRAADELVRLIVLAEGADKRLVLLLTKRAEATGVLEHHAIQVFDKAIFFVRLGARRISQSHCLFPLL